MGIIADALERADHQAFTAPIPKTLAARIRFLVKHHNGSITRTAQTLGVSRTTIDRYLKGQRKNPPAPIAHRIADEVTRRWQPRNRARARRRAATTGGMMVETRARFGYTAAAGSSDDPRLRLLTQQIGPHHAAALFAAQAAGADEDTLANVIALGLQEHYFRMGAVTELEVTLTDIEYLDLAYR